MSFIGPLLHPHQLALLARVLKIYRQQHGQFQVARALAGTTIYDPSMLEGIPCDYADVVALERAEMIDAVGRNEHGISSFAPTALADALVYPDDYLNLSDEAWVLAKDTLRNRPERIRDVQTILRRISDDAESPEAIKDTARAAELLLGNIERYVATGEPIAEPHARTSVASLRALAVMILRQSRAYGPLAIEMATKMLDLFGR